jgi:hypothetical protein
MQASACFRTLTSPQSGPPGTSVGQPLARHVVTAAQTARKFRAMLPPIVGGLHCGPAPMMAVTVAAVVLPPIAGGLHCGKLTGPPTTPSSLYVLPPVYAGPIAESSPGRRPRRLRKVLPPVNGGLHCGTRSFPNALPSARPVFPPVTGGLHCGNGYPAYDACPMASSPIVPWRIPLRLEEVTVTVEEVGVFPRSSAGSIAASESGYELRARLECSTSWTPHRAVLKAHRRPAPAQLPLTVLYVKPRSLLSPASAARAAGVWRPEHSGQATAARANPHWSPQ